MSTTRPYRLARPVRPAVAALPSLEALEATHRLIMQTLVRLQQFVEQVEKRGVDAPARKNAAEACDFFDKTGRRAPQG